MGDYENLDDTIGRMKRAAIDCWMADRGFDPHWADGSYYAKWGWMRHFYTRPNENGVGGGHGDGAFPGETVAADFDQIRQTIDGIIDKWRDLPDGSNNDDPRNSVGTAAAELGSTTSVATLQNNGELVRSNQTIEEVLISNVRGSFKEPFHQKYYAQFSKITSGLGDACVFLEINYAAQSEIWPAVRTDVAQICEEARSVWADQAASSAQASRELILTVAGALVGAVASIVTAGAGTVAVVAALSAAGAVASSALKAIEYDATISGNSYDQILNSFSDSLAALNGVIEEQEETLTEMLTKAVETMSAGPGNFNLDAYELGDYSYGDGTMNIDRTDANMISNSMKRVEAVLASASSSLGEPPTTNPTPRGSGIGRGTSGTHFPAKDLYLLVSRYLDWTLEEYVRGHGLFNATVEHYFETDADSKQTVDALLEDEALNAEKGV